MQLESFVFRISFCVIFAAWSNALTAQTTVNSQHQVSQLERFLTPVIVRYFSGANINKTENGFDARAHAMFFNVHVQDRNGKWRAETTPMEGPNNNGFILLIQFRPGKYLGAAQTPQTLRGPYWDRFINVRHTQNNKQHVWIDFSYGRGIDPGFKKAVMEILGGGVARKAAPVANAGTQ